MDKIVAVIYPVPEKFVGRLLSEKKDVFVKYVARSTNLRIAPGNKLVLYASQGSKNVVGEGVIKTIEFMTPSEVLAKYESRVFLTKDELMIYATQMPGRSPTKKLLVLILSKIKSYSPPLRWKAPITMTGRYLTEGQYDELLREK
jgi:hypothetical protein